VTTTASLTIHDDEAGQMPPYPTFNFEQHTPDGKFQATNWTGPEGGIVVYWRGVVVWKSAGMWRPISEAKKNGTIIWAKFRDDIFPALRPERDDLKRWNGVQVPLRHPGVADDGFDIGWSVAAPVGSGGFPDEWIEGFMPLPAPPTTEPQP